MKQIDYSQLTKLYYSIGEVAKMFDIATSNIRFWEKEFPSLQAKKRTSGNRVFSPNDIKELEKIYHLLKMKGFTIEGAKKALKKKEESQVVPTDLTNNEHIIQRLETIKSKLLRLKSRI